MGLLTKTEVMKLVVQHKLHETFEHSTEGRFDVTAMRVYAQSMKLPTQRVRIMDVLSDLRTQRVISQERILQLDMWSWLHDPAMVIVYQDSTGKPAHLLVDGTHRILRRHQERCTFFSAWFIDIKDAIRPDMQQWVPAVERGIDWGDAVVDGKIVKRDQP
jgi:hypothetical protein